MILSQLWYVISDNYIYIHKLITAELSQIIWVHLSSFQRDWIFPQWVRFSSYFSSYFEFIRYCLALLSPNLIELLRTRLFGLQTLYTDVYATNTGFSGRLTFDLVSDWASCGLVTDHITHIPDDKVANVYLRSSHKK